MVIERIIIKNYKSFKDFELEFTNDCNIIVGDNEAGKSTLLEAINLSLTGQLYGRNISYELSPFLFNKETVSDYVASLKRKEKVEPPKILIELYLKDSPELVTLRGNNNSKRENAIGLFILIQFNEEYADEYRNYIEKPDEIKTVPTEYFETKWYSFDHNQITSRSLPIKTTLIDTTSVRLNNGTDYYIQKTIDDILEKKERAGLSLLYRKLKETFAQEESIKALNTRLKANKNFISHRDLTVSVDISHKTNWDANLTSYLDDIPFSYIGKGDQNVLKMVLALERKKAKESDVILIEEPENHLSFSTMHMLIKMISERCAEKQVIMATHSAFVLNKLGMEKLILLGDRKQITTFKKLPKSTEDYFKKLPGYDTLRVILSKKTILVEGASEELFVQKVYLKKHGKLPIEDKVDIISVRGLSFKRFLDIAKETEKDIVVITDNDGDPDKVTAKYKEYDLPHIKICFDMDKTAPTLESQIAKCNELEVLNKILETEYGNKEELINYMKSEKTECALRFFETQENFTVPAYIENAIE